MEIAVGADHAGVPLNETVIAELKQLGHEIADCGNHHASKSDGWRRLMRSSVKICED